MKNNILLENEYGRSCTGCSMCGAICPTEAIEIKLTNEGFYEPSVIEKKCISCGICKKNCYKFDEDIRSSEENKYIAYSAKNIEKFELETSTSGAVSIELMRQCIKQGYKVVGVAYDNEKEIAVTKIALKESELEQFKGSKYFQSYTLDAIKEIINSKDKYAIFGTPCQIYAIRKFSELKNRDIIFIDLFCHGCPSINLWKKYLEYSKKKFNVDKFENIEFRSKVHGWHEFGFKFKFKNKSFKSNKINDLFYEMFFDMNSHNEACYECLMRSSFYYTDIRMGDFWGYQYDTDKEGVSAIVITSENGKRLFNDVKEKFKTKVHSIDETILAQSYGKEHSINVEKRNKTLKLLSSEDDMKKIIKIYKKDYGLRKKLKKNSKNIVKLLPKSIYFRIKKIIHR